MARKDKSLVITVDDEALSGIRQLAEKLDKSGLRVSRVMPLTGVITGQFAGDMAVLKRLPGVVSVEEELGTQLPPPDSPVQ